MTRTVLGGGAVLDPVRGEVRDADLAMAHAHGSGDPWSPEDLAWRVRHDWKDGVAV